MLRRMRRRELSFIMFVQFVIHLVIYMSML